jgi:glycyl-tRNA synthetase beta chain
MADLLFEILSEEMPAGVQAAATRDLLADIVKRLGEAGLTVDGRDAHGFVTPRRIAIDIANLPDRQPDRVEERKGPKQGAPDQAIQGFLRAAGLTSLDEAELRDGVWFAAKTIPGGPVAALLPRLLIDAMVGLRWPKSMRWRDTRFAWVRPLVSLVGIFDGQVLEGGLQLGRFVEGGAQPGFALGDAGDTNFMPFGNETQGHRFLSPGVIEVRSLRDYEAKLNRAHVVLDSEKRKELIAQALTGIAEKLGVDAVEDDRLLDEVTGLVEYPVALAGRIDAEFQSLPVEVLTTSMRTHQKYFALTDRARGTATHFVVIANIRADDEGAAIIAGNERVLRARLSDARYFWDQDRKTPLDDFAKLLDRRVFHAKLGTVADKVKRIRTLAGKIAPQVGADVALAERAAELCKADLSSSMVGEFPELQGIMGSYYAREQGLPEPIVQAIRYHYAPLGPNDPLPTEPVAVAVALADKIDTLVGLFAADEKPTGSKDPFALRRAALGVVRLIMGNGKGRVLIESLLREAEADLGLETFVWHQVLDFIIERVKVLWRADGLRHDVIDAAFDTEGADKDLQNLRARAEALQKFLVTEAGANLLAGYKRATNILRIEETKDGRSYTGAITLEELGLGIEGNLFNGLLDFSEKIAPMLESERFEQVMAALSLLRELVDGFFEQVKINDPDPEVRRRRLEVLGFLRRVFEQVANFKLIEG